MLGFASHVPQAIGLGTKLGRTLCIACIDSYSPTTMSLLWSMDSVLMNNDCRVPSISEISIRPVLAQKLVPWVFIEITLQSFGNYSLFEHSPSFLGRELALTPQNTRVNLCVMSSILVIPFAFCAHLHNRE